MFGEELLPMAAETPAGHERDDVRQRDRHEDGGGDAMDDTAQVAFPEQRGRAHHWSGYFSANPVQTRVRNEMTRKACRTRSKGSMRTLGRPGEFAVCRA